MSADVPQTASEIKEYLKGVGYKFDPKEDGKEQVISSMARDIKNMCSECTNYQNIKYRKELGDLCDRCYQNRIVEKKYQSAEEIYASEESDRKKLKLLMKLWRSTQKPSSRLAVKTDKDADLLSWIEDEYEWRMPDADSSDSEDEAPKRKKLKNKHSDT